MLKWNDAKKVLPAFIDDVFSRSVLIRVRHDCGSIAHYVAALKCDDEVEKDWSEIEGADHPLYFLIFLADLNNTNNDYTSFDPFYEKSLRIKLENVTHWADIDEPEEL